VQFFRAHHRGERNIIRTLEVSEITHHFSGGDVGLEGISFNVMRGELGLRDGGERFREKHVAQGVGRTIGAGAAVKSCSITSSFIRISISFKRYISYIPQEDAFDEHLTIGENLQFAAAIRSPHLSRRDRSRRLEGKLIELGFERTARRGSGNRGQETLSGGERKRLNIGSRHDRFGGHLSFRRTDLGPELKRFRARHRNHSFDGAQQNHHCHYSPAELETFPDVSQSHSARQGRAAGLFGTPTEMLRYFAEAEHQHQFGADLGACAACGTTRPEFIFDVLETPLRDLSGDIIYEENNRGQLVPARRYAPEFWRDKYEAFRLIQDVKAGFLAQGAGGARCRARAAAKEKNGCHFAGTTNGPNCARS